MKLQQLEDNKFFNIKVLSFIKYYKYILIKLNKIWIFI